MNRVRKTGAGQSIQFPNATSSTIVDVNGGTGTSGWTTFALQPDSGLGSNGEYDLYSTTTNTASTVIFSATFTYSGTLTPGPQSYAFSDSTYASAQNSLTTPVFGLQDISTTTTLISSATSAAIGAGLTITATVLPATATGTVIFYNGINVIGTAPLIFGMATLATSFNSAGNYSLRAMYEGDLVDASSTSSLLTLLLQ